MVGPVDPETSVSYLTLSVFANSVAEHLVESRQAPLAESEPILAGAAPRPELRRDPSVSRMPMMLRLRVA